MPERESKKQFRLGCRVVYDEGGPAPTILQNALPKNEGTGCKKTAKEKQHAKNLGRSLNTQGHAQSPCRKQP